MHIVEVKTGKEKKDFVTFHKELYRKDHAWVCPLDKEIESVFDPLLNPAFKHGEATRWLLKNEDGKTIGRIGAFIDYIRSKANSQPTGGIGYFEVIEDKNAAFLLFDTAKYWLASRGMEAMDGPINFGENDNNWGLLVEGFIRQGFGMPYNKRYYQGYFEEYGFRKYFEQYSYHRTVRGIDRKIVQFPERMIKIADWLAKRPGYTFRHFEFRNSRKYVNDIVEIYNSTWSSFKEDFTPLDPAFLEATMKKTKAFVDEDLIWFAYYNDKPISFFILFPDLNQILCHFNGKINLWNYLKFLWYKLTHEMTRMRAVVGGVNPSYQNSGIESAIFQQLYNVFVRKRWYKELELSWVGDYNPKMIAIYEALGASKAKMHFTYRYLINKDLQFVRYKEEIAGKMHQKQQTMHDSQQF
jgi:GNAT superfamily N-acetyltransferase